MRAVRIEKGTVFQHCNPVAANLQFYQRTCHTVYPSMLWLCIFVQCPSINCDRRYLSYLVFDDCA